MEAMCEMFPDLQIVQRMKVGKTMFMYFCILLGKMRAISFSRQSEAHARITVSHLMKA